MLFFSFCHYIFIAQSSAIGVTWDGTIEHLEKRPVYARVESRGEENFNNFLIANGAIVVDEFGKPGDFDELKNRMLI